MRQIKALNRLAREKILMYDETKIVLGEDYEIVS
jgi:hypothetical protein